MPLSTFFFLFALSSLTLKLKTSYCFVYSNTYIFNFHNHHWLASFLLRYHWLTRDQLFPLDCVVFDNLTTSMLTAVLLECQIQIGSMRSLGSVKSLTRSLFISRFPVGMWPTALWVNLEVSLWLENAMCQISHIQSDI